MRIQPRQGQSATAPGMGRFAASSSEISVPVKKSALDFQGNAFQAVEALSRWRSEEEFTRRQSVRWALDKMPLAVYIEADPGVSVQALYAPLRQWEAASEGRIRFRLVEPGAIARERADIIIAWSDETVLGRENEVGHTERQVRGRTITHARITLIRHPKIDARLDENRRQKRLYTTVLHEMGHALGLEHSEFADDVMHHRGWQRLYLSDNDVRRVRALYKASGLLS